MRSAPRSERWLPPTGITAARLRHLLEIGAPLQVLDVRERDRFEKGHLPGSIYSPDSQPAALVMGVEHHPRSVLICDDGRMSAMVARTLKFSGLADPCYLVGGLRAWVREGGCLYETSQTGQEHRVVPETFGEVTSRRLRPVAEGLSSRILFAALAGAAGVVALIFFAIHR